MQTEIEAKFTDINPEKLREKLQNSGARLIFPERLMKRRVFDFKDKTLEEKGAWMRVRDEGDGKITLSYKCLRERTLHVTQEIMLSVDSFDLACELLKTIGLEAKSFQETKREKWDLGGVEVTIDTWPWIPTFVEVEAENEESIKNAVKILGLVWEKAEFGSVESVYRQHYEVSDEEIDHWESITFIPVPGWLEAKRRINP